MFCCLFARYWITFLFVLFCFYQISPPPLTTIVTPSSFATSLHTLLRWTTPRTGLVTPFLTSTLDSWMTQNDNPESWRFTIWNKYVSFTKHLGFPAVRKRPFKYIDKYRGFIGDSVFWDRATVGRRYKQHPCFSSSLPHVILFLLDSCFGTFFMLTFSEEEATDPESKVCWFLHAKYIF